MYNFYDIVIEDIIIYVKFMYECYSREYVNGDFWDIVGFIKLWSKYVGFNFDFVRNRG